MKNYFVMLIWRFLLLFLFAIYKSSQQTTSQAATSFITQTPIQNLNTPIVLATETTPQAIGTTFPQSSIHYGGGVFGQTGIVAASSATVFPNEMTVSPSLATNYLNSSIITNTVPTVSTSINVPTVTTVFTTLAPLTHVQLIFDDSNSYTFSKTNFSNALTNLSIPFQNLTVTSKFVNLNARKRQAILPNNANDIFANFDIRNNLTNNTQYWTNYFGNSKPIEVKNSNNQIIKTKKIFVWNDTACNGILCKADQVCAVVYSGDYSIKCVGPVSNYSSANSNFNPQYLALLAIPIFLLILIALIVVYCCCCRNKDTIDGKFEMSQIHSNASYGRERNQKNRNNTSTHTISSQGSDIPPPYADDDDEEEEYKYKKMDADGGRSTNRSNMMF